jgi:hypothetical protein
VFLDFGGMIVEVESFSDALAKVAYAFGANLRRCGMWSAFGRVFNWIAVQAYALARRCGHKPAPMAAQTPWQFMAQGRMGVKLMTEEAIQDALQGRQRNGRTQGDDNKVVAPLSQAINFAIGQGDFRLAAEVFRENYAHILAYERQAPPCEMHKGALAFDVARAYLQGWDFFAAMHYFELAERETQLTTADPNFSIYSFDLFEKNFWEAVQVNAVQHPIPIYNELWQIPYNKQSALDDYGEMSRNSKLAYIVASAERVRLQNIADHSGWEGSDALRLGYWTLAADLARLLEVEAKRRYKTAAGAAAPDNITIVPCLEGGFSNTAFGNISDEMQNVIRPMFPRQPPAGSAIPTAAQLYETHFDNMLARIRNPALSRKDRLCTALYLLGFTRNQVAHKIDRSSKLFQQLADAKFLVDLFLTLCRTKEWQAL